jgi:hypothetical protein
VTFLIDPILHIVPIWNVGSNVCRFRFICKVVELNWFRFELF